MSNSTPLPLLLLLLFFSFHGCVSFPDRYLLHGGPSSPDPQEFLDPTLPPFLPPADPRACSIHVLQHDFANTYGCPPAAVFFSPPAACPPPWSRVVLDLSVSSAGDQYDRIAAIWIAGAEVLRTSTVEPTVSGVFWRVRKDVTRYAPLLRRTGGANVSMMLENIVNDVYTGIYKVNVSLEFYPDPDKIMTREKRKDGKFSLPGLQSIDLLLSLSTEKHGKLNLSASDAASPDRKKAKLMPLLDNPDSDDDHGVDAREMGKSGVFGSLGFQAYDPFRLMKSEKHKIPKVSALSDAAPNREQVKLLPLLDDPADLIIPVSAENSSNGFWFRIQNHSEAHFRRIRIPQNTFRAVLEVYVSFHSNDEFWYSNPPDAYIKENNLTTERGNGAFREVFATVDDHFVGMILPFPVIFTGGINPLFWAPVVSIGAFDLPSYNLDLTPFLELLLDGKNHTIGLGVTDGISFWLIDANLHLWLDSDSEVVSAKLVRYEVPPVSVVRTNKFLHLNGTFRIDAERKVLFSGWVNSSIGNLTTDVNHKFKFKSSVDYQNNGDYKATHLKAKYKTEVKTKKSQEIILSRVSHKLKFPLLILTETLPGINNTFTVTTNLSHTLYEEASIFKLEKLISSKILTDRQDASGWMQVQGHSVLSGTADTQQSYQYRDSGKCYSRNVRAKDGVLLDDTTDNVCALAF